MVLGAGPCTSLADEAIGNEAAGFYYFAQWPRQSCGSAPMLVRRRNHHWPESVSSLVESFDLWSVPLIRPFENGLPEMLGHAYTGRIPSAQIRPTGGANPDSSRRALSVCPAWWRATC
jgi:hypothetical protein